MRIVSLLPSATEIVFALGLDEELVGVTFECDHPEAARSKAVVSNTALPAGLTPAEIDRAVAERVDAQDSIYTLDEDALRGLDPELILTQDLCSVCAVDVAEVSDALDHLGCHADVLTLDPKTLEEVLASIELVGEATGARDEARRVVAGLRERIEGVHAAVAGQSAPRTFVLEWTDPPYNAGHWVPDLVTAAGGEPVLSRAGEYSTPVAWPDIVAAAPEVVIVAPCGYTLDGSLDLVHHDARLREQLGRTPAADRVWAVDASAYFVRPGPRLVDGIEILAGILHPHAWAAPAAAAAARVPVTT